MKQYILRIVRFIECIPVIGALLRLCIRLGKATYSYASLHSLCMDIKRKIAVFETCQLPALLESISRINNAFIVSDKTRANFQKSIPVALRKLAQKTNENTALLHSIQETLDNHIAADQARYADLLKDVESRLLELKKRNAEQYEALIARLSRHDEDVSK
jgi:hypothetical protein